MKWELKQVESQNWKQDDSGFYTLINVLPGGNVVKVRLDIMSIDHNPLISFEGRPYDVRIAAMQWLDENCINMSLEHAAYIGWELNMTNHYPDNYEQA